jgi:hypothetical protein
MTSPQHEKTKDKKRTSRSLTIAFYNNKTYLTCASFLEATKG